MTRVITFVGAAAVVGALTLVAEAQSATANKTWVSVTGTDSGQCLITAPCRTIAYAIDETAAAGEVDIEQTGGYGTFTVIKSISVVAADGVLATISVPSGGVGVDIKAAVGDKVLIRGLTIDGHALMENVGVFIEPSSAHVEIKNCEIRNFRSGIFATSGFVLVEHDNLFGSIYNVRTSQNETGSTLGVYIDDSTISNGTYGLFGTSFYSYGTNAINGNGYDTQQASIVAVSKQ